ncbi:MAG TPA: hypothetical protein VK668_07045 [Mucilaginibacter sp.]|nr:hypothetical protein [Mucilaginibacter sp.]
MNEEYLNRVLIYLQQELPEYRAALSLKAGKFVFTLPEGLAFQPFYEKLFAAVSACTGRIRNREYDLDFKVWSPNQERDFTVLK